MGELKNEANGQPRRFGLSREGPLNLGDVSAEYDSRLQYMHYTLADPRVKKDQKTPTSVRWWAYKSKPKVDIYLSDEARDLGLTFKQLKKFTQQELDRIRADPFGETSIDPAVKELLAQQLRSVNRLSENVQSMIKEPIAVKGSGRKDLDDVNPLRSGDREYLIEQYLLMRELQLNSEKNLSIEQRQVLRFAKVYAGIRADDKEYLIMERIENAQRVNDYPLKMVLMGGGTRTVPGFLVAEHPDLVHFFKDVARRTEYYKAKYVDWEEIEYYLKRMVYCPSLDLAGRNVLWYQEGDKKRYVIIDQRKKPRNS